ncbi:glycoside hydrolase [Rickenella mellea]|uniref:Alpha-galactosidase n=1 Tax=Rickenella mellea TaxID=50990 RepID=A0A4Y7PV66_9AGAM|nr:glycoside hydrolase [Rickenella mellea]
MSCLPELYPPKAVSAWPQVSTQHKDQASSLTNPTPTPANMLSPALVTLALISLVSAQSPVYGQCGGIGWTGPKTCVAGNNYYSQCLPGSAPPTTAPPVQSSTKATTAPSSNPTGTPIGSSPTNPPTKAVGKLPALGWNDWNADGCSISEAKVLAAANAFISLGLKNAGYQYVNVDDCWALKARGSDGRIVPDPAKFPNGIASVASKVHALGLKMGIYSDAGTNTCAGYPGSLYNEALDAATFSSWGIDYLKYDNCYVPGNWTDASSPPGGDWYNSNSALRYRRMTAALDQQPNPIEFNLCIWGQAQVQTWGSRVGHSWRITGDASATWSFILSSIQANVNIINYVDFYAHNDMDMMEIGNGALTIQEQRTHFAAWAMLKSPILLGTELANLSQQQVAIITNTEILAFHQDGTIGTPAKPFTNSGSPSTSPPEYYSGTSSKGTHVFVINTGASSSTRTLNFASVPGLGSGARTVHDMWAGQDIGKFTGSYTFTLASHDTAAFRLI